MRYSYILLILLTIISSSSFNDDYLSARFANERTPSSVDYLRESHKLLEHYGYDRFKDAFARPFYSLVNYTTTENRYLIFREWVIGYAKKRNGSLNELILHNYYNSVENKNQAINTKNLIQLYWENVFFDDNVYAYQKVILNTKNYHQDLFVDFLIREQKLRLKTRDHFTDNITKVMNAIGGENSLNAAKKMMNSNAELLFSNLHILEQVDEAPELEKTFDKILIDHANKQLDIDKKIVDYSFDILDDESINKKEYTKKIFTIIEEYDGDYLYRIVHGEDEELLSSEQKYVKKILADLGKSLQEEQSRLASELDYSIKSKKGITAELATTIQSELYGSTSRIFTEKVKRFVRGNLNEIDQVLTDYFQSSQVDIRPKHFQDFFLLLIDTYFKNLPDSIKISIVKDFLLLESTPEIASKFSIIIQNSGPQMQKLLQMIAREDGLSENFSKILKNLESDVKGIPFNQIATYLDENLQHLYPDKLRFLSEEAIGWGTMAGNFQVEIFTDGVWKKAALRVLRPGIKEKMALEDDIFKIAKPIIESDRRLKGTVFENFGDLLKKIQFNTREELNATQTASNQFEAHKFYRSLPADIDTFATPHSIRYSAPQIIDSSKSEIGIIIQEFAEGIRYEEFFQRYPQMQQDVAENIAKLWVREAFFFSGFHHADLHLGNMLFSLDDDEVVNIKLLDYGMAKKVSAEKRGALLRLAQALDQGDKDDILYFSKAGLFEQSQLVDEQQLKAIIQDSVSDQIISLDRFIERIIEKRIDVSDDIISLNRGIHLINQLLENSNSSLNVASITKEAATIYIDAHRKLSFKSIMIPGGYGELNLSPFRSNIVTDEIKRKALKSCKKIFKSIF